MLFDPNTFLNAQQTEAFSTKFPVVPPGTYPASIKHVSAHIAKTQDGDKPVMDVLWQILDTQGVPPEAANKLVKQGIFLDLTPEGNLDTSKDKNVKLGRLRDAVRQNEPGRPWAPSMLASQIAEIEVVVKLDNNGDEQNNVGKVAAV